MARLDINCRDTKGYNDVGIFSAFHSEEKAEIEFVQCNLVKVQGQDTAHNRQNNWRKR